MGWVKPKVMTERNYKVMAELAAQQAKDSNEAFVMALIQTALFQPKGWMAEINSTNGMVEVILYYSLGEFVTLCLKGKRESSFASFLNWAFQKGRGISEVSSKDWRNNCSKACRNLWNEIPRNLKRASRKSSNEMTILYSTKRGEGMSIEEVRKYYLQKEEYFASRGWKRLAEQARMEYRQLLPWR